MNKKYFVLIPFALIITSVVVYFFIIKNKNQMQEIHPIQGPITESIYGLGTVQSNNIFNLKLGVTTMIKKVFVKEGEFVTKGQRLLDFYENAFQNQFAPFEGTVTQLNYYAGETVFPQSPLLTIMDLKDKYISVVLDQEGALLVKKKQIAKLSFNTFKKTFEGTVKSLFPKQGQIVANIECNQLPDEILPGMTPDVAIIVRTIPNATLIPIQAISNGKIQLAKSGTKNFQWTPVQLGIIDADWAEITSPEIALDDTLLIPKPLGK